MITRRILLAGGLSMFSSNGVDQRTADLNLRPQPAVGADMTTLSGRTRVDPTTLTGALHIIFVGQSTNNNSVQGTMPALTNASSIFNLSIAHRGACFVAQTPLLSGDLVLGHHGLFSTDSLITGGYAPKVLITHISCGGSYAADWAPGGGVVGGLFPGTRAGELSYRIGLAARCVANAGLSGLKTIIDWQQGEWDSDNVCTTQANYTSALNGVIAEFKKVGLLRAGNVMFVHQCTRPTNTTGNRNPIRAAQAAVPDGGLVRLGADIDTLDSSNRYDGVHFTVSGAQAQAALKLPLYQGFLAS